MSAASTLVIAGCGGNQADDPRFAYPDEVVENFTTACELGGTDELCSCAIEEFQNTVPFEEFRAIDREIIRNGVSGLSGEQRTTFLQVYSDCGGDQQIPGLRTPTDESGRPGTE